MNTELKNPCLECKHHQAGGDKNDEKCIKCDKRVAYVHTIDKSPSASVSETVDLFGHGGSNLSTINIDDLPGPKCKNDLEADKDPIEDYIKEVCVRSKVSYEKIRSGFKRIGDKIVLHKLNTVRDEIIRNLASGSFGNLTQTQIGKYLGISLHVVSISMRRMGIETRKGSKAKYLTSKFKKTKPIESLPEEQPSFKDVPIIATATSRSKTITLSLDAHPEIYDDLEALAKEQLRSIDKQALWILIKLHERGLSKILEER